eukprot:10390125-Alexandrium_andersonii.AAC.1
MLEPLPECAHHHVRIEAVHACGVEGHSPALRNAPRLVIQSRPDGEAREGDLDGEVRLVGSGCQE